MESLQETVSDHQVHRKSQCDLLSFNTSETLCIETDATKQFQNMPHKFSGDNLSHLKTHNSNRCEKTLTSIIKLLYFCYTIT